MPHASDDRSVFIVHGRDRAARDALFTFLRSLGLRPLEWQQAIELSRSGAPFVGDVLQAAFDAAQAVVILLTPDDLATLREDLRAVDDPPYESALTGQARPNVLFEAGMAFGRHPDQTILVEMGRLRPFSDIGGRHVVRLDGSIARRQELALRLANAGCQVDMTGTDWHTVGDFTVDISADDDRRSRQRDTSEHRRVAVSMPPRPDASEASRESLHDADSPTVPTISLVKTAAGRYQVTVANEGLDDIQSLHMSVPIECPFYLFERQRPSAEVPAGATASYTLVAIHDDPIGVECPFALSGTFASGRDFDATMTLVLGHAGPGT